MLYYFSYYLNGKTNYKTFVTLREAEVFFDILLSAGVKQVRVITFKRRGVYYDKERS